MVCTQTVYCLGADAPKQEFRFQCFGFRFQCLPLNSMFWVPVSMLGSGFNIETGTPVWVLTSFGSQFGFSGVLFGFSGVLFRCICTQTVCGFT